MEKGTNFITRSIQRVLSDEKKEEIEFYIYEALNREFITFTDSNQIKEAFNNQLSSFNEKLNYEEKDEINHYTNLNFRNLNATLRDNWTYESNGKEKEGEKLQHLKEAIVIDKALNKFPIVNQNFKAFRGLPISSFKSFGITTIPELISLKGKIYCDEAFTSTSLIERECFYQKDIYGEPKNVEIEFLIPSESQDGALLSKNNTFSQSEFLLNRYNISKILDVIISEDNQSAKIIAFLIPKSIHQVLTHSNDNLVLK